MMTCLSEWVSKPQQWIYIHSIFGFQRYTNIWMRKIVLYRSRHFLFVWTKILFCWLHKKSIGLKIVCKRLTVVAGFNESGFNEFPGLTNRIPIPDFLNATYHYNSPVITNWNSGFNEFLGQNLGFKVCKNASFSSSFDCFVALKLIDCKIVGIITLSNE